MATAGDLVRASDTARAHVGTVSGTTDASGYLTVTHGAGFTPTVVLPVWTETGLGGGPSGAIGTDTIGATTFRVRLGGTSNGNRSTSFGYVCFA